MTDLPEAVKRLRDCAGWNECPCREQLEAVIAAAEDERGESHMNLRQQIAALQSKIDKMTVRLTEEGLNALAMQVAKLVEDQFAMGHEFGRGERLMKVQLIVREALREIATGEKKWDAWKPSNQPREVDT